MAQLRWAVKATGDSYADGRRSSSSNKGYSWSTPSSIADRCFRGISGEAQETYSGYNAITTVEIRGSQTITPASGSVDTTVELLLGRDSTLSGTVYLYIFLADSDHKPIAVVASSKLAGGSTDGSTLPDSADPATFEWREITFDSVTFVTGTKYAICLSLEELVAPTATTSAATSVTSTTATLNGSITSLGGWSCQYYFEYGRTTNYGSTTTVAYKYSGTIPAAVSANLADLLPGTLCHYRIVIQNPAGIAYGADQTFITQTQVLGGDRMEGLVGSLRHTWTPGNYRLEIGLGGYGRAITTITSGDTADAMPEPEPDLVETPAPAMKYYPPPPKKKKEYEKRLGRESPWAYEEEAIELLGPKSKDFLKNAPWRKDPKGLTPEAIARLERARKAYFVKMSKEKGAAAAIEYFGELG